ncbi:MAG: DUF1844 domain-containing protein [Candidatus Eremiobacteraeota bacterium]|nr:DUF1844 domain-containing protein [Candidatus Eremiobacteraeota bacterium]
MATPPPATHVPPVEVILSEVVASLAFAAHAYLEPAETEEREADLDAADIALDVAGRAFDRIQMRLEQSERSAIARLLTDMRLAYVKKRGL